MANTGQRRATTVALWISGLVVLGLIVYGVRWFTRDEVEVRVVPVTYETLSKTVSTNGKVEPVEEFQAHAPFPGVIRDIYVGVGQKVAKGDLLVKMDDADARARLATAEANLSNALNNQRDIQSGGNREDQNRFKGAASPAEVAAAQQRLDAANLSLATARQHLTQRYNPQDAENAAVHVADARAAVASAEDNLANVIIRSPLKGTVYNVPVNQYDFVPFGYDILDVADLTRLQVRAFFDEPEIGGLAPGQPVKIVWDAKPGEVWHGHVALAPTTIFAYNTRSVGVCIITVDDPTPDLIPNTNVTVSVTEMERPHVLSIPREAWHVDGQRSFVYRIVNGTLVETPVKVGVISLTNVEIVSGLAANDIIVKGAKSSVTDLSNGLRVKQVE